MTLYSYKLDHDYGFSPNPFGEFCTLANCKPDIRRNKKLQIGDWVLGTGSEKLKLINQMIYLMEVNERITYDEYWNDPRFRYKKPSMNGSLVQMYGDNIYHRNGEGEWLQSDSAHSLPNGEVNEGHLKTDTGGENVLISTNFYYFGDNNVFIPDEYRAVCNPYRNFISNSIPEEVRTQFIDWVQNNFENGIHGNPINWREHQQKVLPLF